MPQRMNPQTVLVKAPDAVATRYVENRRNDRSAIAAYTPTRASCPGARARATAPGPCRTRGVGCRCAGWCAVVERAEPKTLRAFGAPVNEISAAVVRSLCCCQPVESGSTLVGRRLRGASWVGIWGNSKWLTNHEENRAGVS